MFVQKTSAGNRDQGFSLIEVLIATALTTVSLLAALQLLYMAMSASSLARSKGTAALSAMNKLECLSDSYARDPFNGQVLPGNHGPEEIKIVSTDKNGVLNRFQVVWTGDDVDDPRPGKILIARRIRVTVTPVLAGGAVHYQPGFNKILSVTTVFSPGMP